MKKFITMAVAGVLSVGIIGSTLQTADAHRRHWHHSHGGNVGAGIALGLIGGAIIGGAIARDRHYRNDRRYYKRPARPRRVRLNRAHVRWCGNRYRSYRSWDNTFQPYNGRRQVCLSPYR